MAAYLIVDTLLENPDLYETYKSRAKPLAEKYGGEYLARGGPMTLKETDLWSPTRLVLVKFPDAATANRFYDSTYHSVADFNEDADVTSTTVKGGRISAENSTAQLSN